MNGIFSNFSAMSFSKCYAWYLFDLLYVPLSYCVPTQNEISTKPDYTTPKLELVWHKIFFIFLLHVGAIYGFYLVLVEASWTTWFYIYILSLLTSQGVGAGAHRLWAHRTYTANLPLRIYLAFNHTLSFQTTIYDWVRDHRVHHKYADTDFDPHNATRGFFFSHMGWLMVKKSKALIEKAKQLDMSDLEADSVVMFQRKYFWILTPFITFIIPAVIPWYFWGEPFWSSFFTCGIFRQIETLHIACLVNSAAHMWGNRPYNKNIRPTEISIVSHLCGGEGFHNYHHTFPWDYKAAEFGKIFGNTSTAFIDLMAKIGWARNLKSVNPEIIKKRVQRTGDGSWRGDELEKKNVWGWGDTDMEEEEKKMVKVTYSDFGKA